MSSPIRISDQFVDIFKALSTFQGKSTPPPKNKEVTITGAKGSYTFRYAELPNILEHVKGIAFVECGLGWFSTIVYPAQGAPVLVTRLFHSSGQWIETDYRLPASNDPKQFAGEITYGRRYSVGMLLGIASEEDADSLPPKQQFAPRPDSRQQQNRPPQGNAPGPQSKLPVTPKVGGTVPGAAQQLRGAPQSAGPVTNPSAAAGPANPNQEPADQKITRKDFDALLALVADQTRFNPWSKPELTEYMQAKFKLVELDKYTRPQYLELFEAVQCLSFNQAMELVIIANQPRPDEQGAQS